MIAIEGVSAFRHLGRLLRFNVTDVSSRQFSTFLGGDGKAPEYDITAIRKQGPQFLLESLDAEDPVRKAAEAQLAAGEALDLGPPLTGDEITAICSSREDRKAKPCPKRTLGAQAQALLGMRDLVFANYSDVVRRRLGADFDVLIYSHTHNAKPAFRPKSKQPRRWTPLYINSGAWQRVVSVEQMKEMQRVRGLDDKGVLALGPESLPACYDVVLVEPYTDSPKPLLRHWAGSPGEQRLVEDCK